MLILILPITLMFLSICVVFLSKRKKYFMKIVDLHGEEYAKKHTKAIKRRGIILFILSSLSALSMLLLD